MLFLGFLIAKYKFSSATLNFLMVGHTHEDIDQFFGIVCSLILSKDSYQTPDEIMEYLVSHLRPRCLSRGEELTGEFVHGVRDFQLWLAPLGVHLFNAFANRDGVESPHSFTFRQRRDCMGAEFRVRGVDSPTVVGDGNPGDVLCCVKTYMRDTVLQQPPLIVLPESQVGRVLQREPAGIVPPRPFSPKEIESYVNLADVCEHDLELVRAGTALRNLVYNRVCAVPRHGWLGQPGHAPLALPTDTGNPYFPHLPETSSVLKAQRREATGSRVQARRAHGRVR